MLDHHSICFGIARRRPLLIASLCLLVGASAQGQELYFPGDGAWASVSASDVGWNATKIDTALDFAMDRNSSSVVILHGGRILAERHQKVLDPSFRYSRMIIGTDASEHNIEDVASVQKSVVSFLVGVALDKRLLRLEDSAQKHLGKGWSQATDEQEREITLRHLITMSSGLNNSLKFNAPAGTKWAYNTNAYAQSLVCVERASGMSANELTKQWLLEPVGMRDSRWEDRPLAKLGIDIESANGRGFATTARDLARFGLLIQADGKWKEQRLLVNTEYLHDALNSSQQLNLSYGYLWWLNGKPSAVRGIRTVAGSLVETAPPDMVAALGALGRKCYVVPSLNLVVTRLGDDPDKLGQKKFDTEFWRLLMEAKQR